jgi:hypothetical protein
VVQLIDVGKSDLSEERIAIMDLLGSL